LFPKLFVSLAPQAETRQNVIAVERNAPALAYRSYTLIFHYLRNLYKVLEDFYI